MSKQLVGLVGWRGMVGSVLMDRMLFEVESEVGTTAEAYQQRQVSMTEGKR